MENTPMVSNQAPGTGVGKIILAIVLLGVGLVAGYLIGKGGTGPVTATPSPTWTPRISSTMEAFVSLGEQFTLEKGQVAKIAGTGLEVEITKFYNSPCPPGTQCIWSGVGVGLRYRLNGEVKEGTNLVQAFGYKTTIVKTDYENYANLVIEKMSEKKFANILRVYEENGKRLIKVDFAEYLTGAEADAEARLQGSPGGASNGFIIRNADKTATTLTIANSATFKIVDWQKHTETGSLTSVTYAEFKERFNNDMYGSRIGWLTIQNGVVTSFEEQYIP